MTEVKKKEFDSDLIKDVTKKPYRREIVWINLIGFLTLHLAALYGWYLAFTTTQLYTWIWGFFVGFTSGFGVGIGAHRYYTHRAFKAKWPIRLALVAAHTLAGQNCLYIWVREHRQHHKYTDTNADPHNSTRGFFFSHIGWLMVRKHPDVIEKGKTMDMSDLEADPFVMFQKKYYKTLFFFVAFLPVFMVPHYFWNEPLKEAIFGAFFARFVLTLNFTWLVNSAAHLYGTRPYNNKIQPVENAFVAWASLGEGWHNYHHTFPWDYRASEFGAKYSMSTDIIDWLASKGWVYDLKQAPKRMVKKWAQKYGDGTHAVYGVDGEQGIEGAEIKYTSEKCAVTDLEAFKNIENDYDSVTKDEIIQTNKEPSLNVNHVSHADTVHLRS